MTISRVYFLRPVGMDGPIKIGYSTDVEGRLKSYSHLSPFPLEIAATTPGDFELEQRLHRAFADDHSHHEWFRAGSALLGVIAAINAGSFDASELPDGRPLKRVRVISPESRRSSSLSMRLTWLRRRGVPIPDDVSTALARFSVCRYAVAGPYRQPEDGDLVEAFLNRHQRAA